MDGLPVTGPVVVFDDDHYYLGAVLAEKLRLDGLEVTLVTPADRVSAWTINTLEQHGNLPINEPKGRGGCAHERL